MLNSGESQKEIIRPDFNRAIMIDFQGATINSDAGFILLREIDDRFKIIAAQGRLLGGAKVIDSYHASLNPDDSLKGLTDTCPLS